MFPYLPKGSLLRTPRIAFFNAAPLSFQIAHIPDELVD